MINVTCAAAKGADSVPVPTLILPGKSVPIGIDHDMQLLWNWGGSESGWINNELWVEWVMTVFVPWITEYKKKLSPPPVDSKVLLWSDGHKSRYESTAITALEAA